MQLIIQLGHRPTNTHARIPTQRKQRLYRKDRVVVVSTQNADTMPILSTRKQGEAGLFVCAYYPVQHDTKALQPIEVRV